MAGWLVGWSWLFGSLDRSFVRACVGSLVRSLVRACAHQLVGLVGWVGWLGWLVGWLGWLVCACVHEFRSFAHSFVRSLALDIAFALDLTLAPDLAHTWLRHRTAGCSSVKVHGSKLGTFQRWPKASLATARYRLRKRSSPCGAFARLRTSSPPACGASLPRGMLSS
jgi:hypothetical protein